MPMMVRHSASPAKMYPSPDKKPPKISHKMFPIRLMGGST
jgi:hypothetical protein